METIATAELPEFLRARPGLIFGPSFSAYPGVLCELGQTIAFRFNMKPAESLFSTADRLIATGVEEALIRAAIRQAIDYSGPSMALTQVAKVNWSAVISASLDSRLDTRLQHAADSRPSRRPYCILTELSLPRPPRMTPIYRLLGSTAQDDFTYSTVTLHSRRPYWRHAVRGFADCLRGGPVLCIGMTESEDVLFELMSLMRAEQGTMPSKILFLGDDPIGRSPNIPRLLGSSHAVLLIDGTLADTLSAMERCERSAFSPSLPFPRSENDRWSRFRSFEDLATVVNQHASTSMALSERQGLLELLFSPGIPRWDPYVHNLDLPRTLTTQIKQDLESLITDRSLDSAAIVIRGSSASGKSTVMKRIALELAKGGTTVLWFRPWFSADCYRALQQLFMQLGQLQSPPVGRVVALIDDPLSFGTSSTRDIVAAAHAAQIPLFLVMAMRTVDWATTERSDVAAALPIVHEYILEDDLDTEEWAALPEYLVRLGVAGSIEDAERRVAEAKGRSARDTLSMLYWLLPATRPAIASSVRQEYFRLGDLAGLTRVILGDIQDTTALLRTAYELVAVANHYESPLPVEVLVSALGVDYGAWISVSHPDAAAWGLLYCDESQDGDTVHYRTRNSIITNLLLELINGGTLGHSGELRALSQLIKGCGQSSSPLYREFCVRVLVPYKKLKRLNYEEGLRLYDEAIGGLPFPDKTLVHHKGLWISNCGCDPVLARQVLEEALSTETYPYASRVEMNEHIHTSYAAATLAAIDANRIALEQGKMDMLSHLSRARSPHFFNAHAVHVQAGLILRLAQKLSPAQTVDVFELVNRALADIDLALLVVQSPLRAGRKADDDIAMLEEVRGRFETTPNYDQTTLCSEADRIWRESQSQQGFILAARRLYERARIESKGRRFHEAHSYCVEVLSRITAAGAVPAPGLSEVAATLYYDWRVRKRTAGSRSERIDWQYLQRHVTNTLSGAQARRSAFYIYLHAVCLAQLGLWPDALSLFAELRALGLPQTVLWEPRGCLYAEDGTPARVQGIVRQAVRRLLYVDSLATDFRLDPRTQWPRQNEIATGFIQFAFGGPTVIDEWALQALGFR